MFGRKNLYNAGFAVFTLGSLLAGLSQPQYHGWDLVLFREVQGFRRRSAINQQRCYSHRCFPARSYRFRLRGEPDRLRGRLPCRTRRWWHTGGNLVAMDIPDLRAFGSLWHPLENVKIARARITSWKPEARLTWQALSTFETGMHQAFPVSFAITIIAAVVSYLRSFGHRDLT